MNIWLKSAFTAAMLLGTAGSVPAFADDITLTMWGQGDCPPDNCMGQALIDAFQKANPGVKINLVQQPVDGYFTNLLAQSVIGRGPDIASMWAGGYMDQFKTYMVDLHKYIPASILDTVNGVDFFSEGYDHKNAVYAAPNTAQWYIGYYNKKVFKDAGIDKVPTDWDELSADSKLLKAKGYTPIVQGAVDGGASFAAWEDWSYLAAALQPSDWSKMLSGQEPYNNPTMVTQLTKWNQLFKDGDFNQDAYNSPTALTDFTSGKAGMYLGGGSWQAAQLVKAMGDDVGIIVPPYSDAPTKAAVSFAGGGYSVMNYSKNIDTAGKFAAFVLSDDGQKIIAQFDAPTRPGFPNSNPLLNDMANLSGNSATVNYPMFDNFTQAPVTDAMARGVPQVLVGQQSPADALSGMDAAYQSLPADQKTPVVFASK
ncbi:MAG TPA: extracellular solute-binding protein [Devosia sp.]|nr:extracellular solute-binding protein [Devosia sp.]